MKSSLIALTVLSAFACAASAQSSVTLSGAVDLGVRRADGAWNMQNAGSSRTNFALSGTEDLGGGMNAFFYIQHRFHLNTGAQRDANAFWRQGWVGLGGGFGNLRLGKILPPVQALNGDFEPFGADYTASVNTGGIFAGHQASGARYNNSIYSPTPTMGGLTGHAVIAAADNNSEVPSGTVGSERPVGFGLNYSVGPIRVAAAYDRNANDKKTIGVYGLYNAGFAQFMAQYEKGDTYSATIEDVARWSVGVKVPLGAVELRAGYLKASDEDFKKIGIGALYNLSKRTNLYSTMGKYSGHGVAGTLGLTGNTSATGGTLSDNNRKTRFDVGIQHRF